MTDSPANGNGQDKAEKLRDLLDLVDDSEISSIKSTVSELIRLINDPRSSARDLKQVIELDPPLTAKLLKLANSAFYGFPRTIGDIQEAVVCVGFNELKELALNQKISQLFDQDDVFAGYSRRLLWKHSVAAAVCGKLIVARHLEEVGGNAYVLGLIHDIGVVIEDQFLLDEFFQVLDEVGSGELTFVEAERRHLDFDHSDIGHAVAVDWNFPEEIAAAIRYHHRPLDCDDPDNLLLCVLYIADSVCQREKIGYADESRLEMQTFRQCMDRVNSEAKHKLTDKALEELLVEVREQIIKMEKSGWF